MDIEDVIGKYTGHPVTWDDLAAARRGDPVLQTIGHALHRAAAAVDDAETELAGLAGTLIHRVITVARNLDAPADQPVPGVNPLGELQAAAVRFDALIGQHADRIAHLRTLAALWRQANATMPVCRPGQATSVDLADALTGLGLHPLTPAHPDTTAAYGQQHGGRRLDVSVNPFGEPGVEVNAGHSDGQAATVAWTATFGPDTPAPVVVAAVRAALTLHGADEAEPATPQPQADVAAQVDRYVADIIAAIDGDIAEGALPGSVACFGDLHTYLDANAYLDEAGVPMPTAAGGLDIIVAVQDEVSRRLSAPGRVHCTYGACAYPRHDHTTTQGPDGGDLDEPVAMFCEHCGQPAHYDEKLRRYRHDDPATPDCFLISRDPR